MRIRHLSALLVVATFGPYLGAGIRVEQLVIYTLTALAVVRHLRSDRPIDSMMLALIAIWGTITAVSLLSGAFPPHDATGSMLAGIDALIAPLAVMILVAVWSVEADPHELLLTVQKWTVALMVFNAGMAWITSQNQSLWPVLSQFWWAGSEDTSTGLNAAQMGRYGGIFNTPLSAGVAYSIALCALLHLYYRQVWRPSIVLLSGIGLVLGAVLSQSKLSLLGGIPIAILLAAILFMRKRPGTLAGLGLAGLGGLAIISRTDWWEQTGLPYFQRLAAGSDNPLRLYSAGRYDETAAVRDITETVMSNAPLAGYGTRGAALGPLDTAWVEMLARGGIIALVLYVAWISIVANKLAISRHFSAPRELWWTTAALFVVAVGASTGGPALTQNRGATLLLLNLLLAAVALRPSSDSKIRGANPEIHSHATNRNDHTIILKSRNFAVMGAGAGPQPTRILHFKRLGTGE